ncbi:MAG: hypothetical protein AB9869_38240 [Verrucomicrobiia bacterium]
MSLDPILTAACDLQGDCRTPGRRYCFIGGIAVQRWFQWRFDLPAVVCALGWVMPRIRRLLEQSKEIAPRVLTEQTISMESPGTILRDVQTLIDLIGPEGIPTKSKQGNPPTAALPEINRRLSNPIDLNLQRPLLRDYPKIAGIYILLRVMDLIQTRPNWTALDQEMVTSWNTLNPAEKYFALLEAWLLHAEDEVLGRSSWKVFDQFSSNLLFLAEQVTTRNWRTFDECCHRYDWRGGISTWNVQLQAQFGLIEIKPRPVKDREATTQGWLLGRAKRTPFGEAVVWTIADFLKRQLQSENEEEDEDEDEIEFLFLHGPDKADYGFFQPAFSPYFPEWKLRFKTPEPAIRPGRYIFKVMIDPKRYGKGVWRLLSVSGGASLAQISQPESDLRNFSRSTIRVS